MTEVKWSSPPRGGLLYPRAGKMRELTVDDVQVKIYEADVPVFLEWIQAGEHPVWFRCSGCKYAGTAKLQEKDVAYASTGATYLTCPSCEKEMELCIPLNCHELTKQSLEAT